MKVRKIKLYKEISEIIIKMNNIINENKKIQN